MNTPITNHDDVIDSRDVIARIEELEDLIENEDQDKLEDEKEELQTLKDLAEEASSTPHWPYGESLVRDSYFTEYVEQLCEDIGDIPSEFPAYIANHIDWEGVARDIQMDYTSVEFDDVTYWIRA